MYALKRRAILDSKGYSHIPLVVSEKMFSSIADINHQMTSIGVDFRTGNVPDRLVVYITEANKEEMITELLSEPLLF